MILNVYVAINLQVVIKVILMNTLTAPYQLVQVHHRKEFHQAY